MMLGVRGIRQMSLCSVFVLCAGVSGHATEVRTPPEQSRENADRVVAYDRSDSKTKKAYTIAYLTECVDNPYCVARLQGIEDASKKYGISLKVFDSKWSLINQQRTTEIAASEGTYDGYLFGPLAPAPSCKLWKRVLVPTGKPVVTVTVPMCGDADYTDGLAATFTQQGEVHYQELVDYAFASCKSECQVLAVGGFIGSQLQNYWEAAVKRALAKYPNAKLVAEEAANFDPRNAYQKTQNALTAHPEISVVVSNWDDMSRGIEEAIAASGREPGKDVRIYSAGANTGSVKKIKEGKMNASLALLPYDEGYYSTVALIMAMEGSSIDGYIDESWLPQVMDSTQSPLITPENVDKWVPRMTDSPFKY